VSTSLTVVLSCPLCTLMGRPKPSRVVFFHCVVVVPLAVVLMVAVWTFGLG